MTDRLRFSERGVPALLVVLLASIWVLAFAGAASGEDTAEAEAPPSSFDAGWLQLIAGEFKGVIRDGSRGKFREDYNIQTGPDFRLNVLQDAGEGSFGLRGFGQVREKQGYLVGDYASEGFDIALDLQAWTEYYNDRDGDAPSPFAPGTNNGRRFYGSGLPSTDWLTGGGDFRLSIGSVFHDAYGDFHYRDVNGDQTTLKGGSVGNTPVDIGGPGSVDFSFPGRKKVDYDAYMGLLGGTSGLGNINWQTNAVYQFHSNQSKQSEAIYRAGDPVSTPDEFNRYDEDTDIHLVRYDISGGRNVSSDVYLFGSGFVSYERADPNPQTQLTNATGTFNTRQTDSSKVTRWTPAMTFGGVFTPANGVVVSADASVRGYIQDGDLDESRSDDTFFPPGDIGTVTNDVDRKMVASTVKIDADWKVARRFTMRAEARYQYRWEDVDASARLAFSPIEPTEIEDFKSDQHRLKAGVSGRYRMTRGRYVELGYQLSYTDVDQDVNRLQNQFIMGDYNSLRQRVHLKAAGRIVNKLRGELRGQYVYEKRDNDAPSSAPVIDPGQSGKVETHYWNISPVLYWIPNAKWSFYGNYAISYLEIEPDNGSAFDYNVLTNSMTAGSTWSATEQLSTSVSYTFYVNDDDIQNVGHNASLNGRFDFNDNWGMTGGYRYLGYRLDGTGVDDYDAHVLSIGVTGKF